VSKLEIPDERIEVDFNGRTYVYWRFKVYGPDDEPLFEWIAFPIDADKLKHLVELYLHAFETGRRKGRQQKAYEIREVLGLYSVDHDTPIA